VANPWNRKARGDQARVVIVLGPWSARCRTDPTAQPANNATVARRTTLHITERDRLDATMP